MSEEHISEIILDEVTARFICGASEFINLKPEEYFFLLEEAFWFATDFLELDGHSLISFSSQLLKHNGIVLDCFHDYSIFKTYKQSIKVFGTMLFSPGFTHCLLVQQAGSSHSITFPKGKKAKNESGLECAVRETREEVGYDASDKIIDIPVTVFGKITFYFVLNVRMDYGFKTSTRNEINRIFWFDLSKVEQVKTRKNYRIFYAAYAQALKMIRRLKKNAFKFDLERIYSAIDKSVECP